MTDSSDSRVVARAAAVNVLGMLAKASRALVTVFVTRVSGPVTFGLFTLTVAVVELISRFTIFGMDKSLLKYLPEVRTRNESAQYPLLSTVFYAALGFALLATGALAWSAPWIAEVWLGQPVLVFPLRLMALAVAPLTFLSLLLAATKALKIMKYDALVSGLIAPLAMLVLSVPILWTEDDVVTLAFAYLGSTAVASALALWFFRAHFQLRATVLTSPRIVAREVLGFSTPLGLHDFVQYLATKLELFLLAYFVSPLDLGIYALASELAFVLKKFRQNFDPILIPLMSEAWSLGQRQRLEAHVGRVVRWILMFGVPYVGALILFGEPILRIFGEGFATGGLALLLLCLAQFLNVGTGLIDTAMLVSGRPRINLLNVCILIVSQTALNLWLIPRAGILGAAAAALAAFAILAVVRLIQSLTILHLNPFEVGQLKPLAAGIGAALTVLALMKFLAVGPATPFWLLPLALFVLIYSVLLKLLGLDDEDVALIRSAIRRLTPSRTG